MDLHKLMDSHKFTLTRNRIKYCHNVIMEIKFDKSVFRKKHYFAQKYNGCYEI